MGREKFNITVTIDNGKALKIAGFLTFRVIDGVAPVFKYGGEAITFQEPIEIRKFCCADYPGVTFPLKFFCHIRPLKMLPPSDFSSAGICVERSPRCRLRFRFFLMSRIRAADTYGDHRRTG
jgi:hypothetical protein